jgi:YgiT-type zinc finger domain-containing protein
MKRGQSFTPPSLKAPYPRRCVVCGGRIKETTTTLTYPSGDGNVRLVRDVPAGVCESCGEEYLRAEIAGLVEELLESAPDSKVEVPIWRFVTNT